MSGRQAAMRAMMVVEVLPLGDLVVEQFRVVDHDAVQEAVELLGVDPVGPFNFAVELRGGGLDVAVPDALVEQVPADRCSRKNRLQP